MMNCSAEQSGWEPSPDPVIEAYKRDVDRSLIRENLRLTVEERFQKLMRLIEFAEELKKAGAEAKR